MAKKVQDKEKLPEPVIHEKHTYDGRLFLTAEDIYLLIHKQYPTIPTDAKFEWDVVRDGLELNVTWRLSSEGPQYCTGCGEGG